MKQLIRLVHTPAMPAFLNRWQAAAAKVHMPKMPDHMRHIGEETENVSWRGKGQKVRAASTIVARSHQKSTKNSFAPAGIEPLTYRMGDRPFATAPWKQALPATSYT